MTVQTKFSAWKISSIGKLPGARTRIEVSPQRWTNAMRTKMLRTLETGVMGGYASVTNDLLCHVLPKVAPVLRLYEQRYRRAANEWTLAWDNTPGMNYELHKVFAELARAHQVTDKLTISASPEMREIEQKLATLNRQTGDHGYLTFPCAYIDLVRAVAVKYGSTMPEVRQFYDPLLAAVRANETFAFEFEEPATPVRKPRKKKVKPQEIKAKVEFFAPEPAW